ncbi:MAG TPA: hypothetical protein VH306_00915 [Gaiellaceae bacterium]
MSRTTWADTGGRAPDGRIAGASLDERDLPFPGHEAEVAELAERIELLQGENAELRRERERLATELLIARCWVKELALWFDEAKERLPERALLVTGLGADATEMLDETRLSDISLRRLAVLSGAVIVPWLFVLGVAGILAWIFIA